MHPVYNGIGDSKAMSEHAQLVRDLKKPALDIHKTILPLDLDLIHMIMGISGEAGELLDAVKKCTIYRKPIDISNVIEELGDLEFYLEGLRQILGLTREEVLKQNIAKLRVRYGQKYSDKAAQDRVDKATVLDGAIEADISMSSDEMLDCKKALEGMDPKHVDALMNGIWDSPPDHRDV